MTTSTPNSVKVTPPRKTWFTWLRENLFNTWYNGLLTLVFGSLAAYGALAAGRTLFGFDYTILRVNLTLLMVGRFPRDMLWRPWLSGLFLVIALAMATGLISAQGQDKADQAGLPFKRARLTEVLSRGAPVLILIVLLLLLTETITPTLLTLGLGAAGVGAYFLGRVIPQRARRPAGVLVAALIVGGYLALAAFGGIGWSEWGGLHLNVFLTLAGILFAFPLGLLLALGRRSSLPAVRTVSVTYIELVRGVPLITILLFAAFAIGFMLPEGIKPSLITRILVAITLFEAAYIAEVVRGGLQALPKGQVEAGQSLGLPAWKTTRLIVLPQALRHTIPPMVGQFIALYKDTTLIAILNVLDVLNVSFIINSQPEFLGRGLFVLTMSFAALVFWVGAFTMSREARRLEKKLGVGER